jgi:hypothetical protein
MATTVTPVVTQFGWTWLKAHERLVMLALVLAVGTFGISKYFDVDAARKDARVVAAEQIVTNDQKNSAALAFQTAQATAALQAEVQADRALVSSLAASVAARNTGLTTQQHKDSFASMADILGRWAELVPAAKFDGSPVTANNGIDINLANARATVIELEKVPVLTQNLVDETSIVSRTQDELDGTIKVNTDLNAQITGLNKNLTDSANACKVEIAAVKADARKSKMKFFKWGFITGFVSGLYLGHAAGL